VPVIQPAPGEASQRIARATSSGSPRRPTGYIAAKSASRAAKSGRSTWASGVRTTAGSTALQRMPSPPYSTATQRVSAISAPLAAA
jgi:hypothetical protein